MTWGAMAKFLSITCTILFVVACATTHPQSRAAFSLVMGDSSRPVQHGDESSEVWFISAPKTCLYAAARKLACIDWFSISPSGGYALYEKKSKIWLYDAASERGRVVLGEYGGWPGTVAWAEDVRKATIAFSPPLVGVDTTKEAAVVDLATPPAFP